jgi:twinkle protein
MTTYRFSDYGIICDESKSGWQKVSCPQCTPHRKKQSLKDLGVNAQEGGWICHHCGWKGSLGTKQRIDRIKMDIKPKVYKRPEKVSSFNLPENMNAYWSSRGISQATMKRCGVGYERAWMPQTKKEHNCTIFSYYIKGELINKKYRTGNKLHKLSTGARLVFYAPLAKENYQYKGDLYITEGEPDCLSMIELGFENTISPPNGAPAENVDIQSVDFSYMDSLEEIAPSYNRVFLIMDNDHVGSRFRDEFARRFGYERCFKAEYPEGCKDINDVLKNHGREKAIEVVKNCKPYPIEGMYSVSDLLVEVERLYKDGFEKGLPVGWHSVDRLYTARQKEFTILTGIPSHGKSSWLDHVMVNLAKDHNWKFAIFSPENFPFERHIAKFCEIYIGKPFDKNFNGYMNMDELEKAVKFCHKHFHFIMPPEDDEPSLDKILKLARAAIFKHGINGLLIDPWNEIEHDIGKDTETNYISRSLSKVRKFCRINNIHTWIVAHPTKLQKNGKGEYPVPTPYDISGGAHWRNKADNCLCVHRDFENGISTIYCQKIRFKEIGKTGKAKMMFDVKNGRFREIN